MASDFSKNVSETIVINNPLTIERWHTYLARVGYIDKPETALANLLNFFEDKNLPRRRLVFESD